MRRCVVAGSGIEANEVAADMGWDVLENEDTLTDAHRSMQGPFPFHAEGSESMRSAEPGPSVGPVGAGGSTATPRVLTRDGWMGGGGSAAAPEVPMFLQRGRSLGLASKKSLALQARRTSLPDIASVSGRSGTYAVASLAGLAPPAVAPAPSVVTEQAAAEVTSPSALERTELPSVLVASSMVGVALQAEGPASPVEVAVTRPRQEQPDATTVVSEGAAESTLPEAKAEVTTTTTSSALLDVATVVSEGAAQSAPPAAQAAAPEAGQTGEDAAGGSPGIVAVVERPSRGSPSALVLGGSCSPA
ncbi:uncharacterized protein [Miscanthus floridulus]|uniref:uncharacterized protein n=1 Tax=Miscanthus floridulus TaxID=154761 RepID=UPI00345A7CBF